MLGHRRWTELPSMGADPSLELIAILIQSTQSSIYSSMYPSFPFSLSLSIHPSIHSSVHPSVHPRPNSRSPSLSLCLLPLCRRTSSAYNMPSFRAGAQLLSSLSGYAYTKRAWKKEVLDLYMDPLFFHMDPSCACQWVPHSSLSTHTHTHTHTHKQEHTVPDIAPR